MDPIVTLPIIIAIVWGLFIKVRKMRRDDTPMQEIVTLVIIVSLVLVCLAACWWMTAGGA